MRQASLPVGGSTVIVRPSRSVALQVPAELGLQPLVALAQQVARTLELQLHVHPRQQDGAQIESGHL